MSDEPVNFPPPDIQRTWFNLRVIIILVVLLVVVCVSVILTDRLSARDRNPARLPVPGTATASAPATQGGGL